MAVERYIRVPLSALWRARGYLAIGALLWLLGQLYSPIYSWIPDAQRTTWQSLVNKLSSFEIDKIGLILIFAGIVYAVLSEVWEVAWSDNLQSEVRAGFKNIGDSIAAGVQDITSDSILLWLSQRRATNPDSYRYIAKNALHAYYGKHTESENNYVDFVVDNIIDKSAGEAGITRENLISRVVLRRLPNQKLLRWQETRSYALVCPSSQGQNPLLVDVRFRADEEHLRMLIDSIDEKVIVERTLVFDFKQWFDSIGKRSPRSGENISVAKASLNFDGTWVRFRYETQVPLTKVRTYVEIIENSFMQESERSYTLSISQPTRGLDFNLSLADNLDGWTLREPVVSAARYSDVRLTKPDEQNVTASVPGWVLPGVALAVEWTAPEVVFASHKE